MKGNENAKQKEGTKDLTGCMMNSGLCSPPQPHETDDNERRKQIEMEQSFNELKIRTRSNFNQSYLNDSNSNNEEISNHHDSNRC